MSNLESGRLHSQTLSFPRKREPTRNVETICEPMVFVTKVWVPASAGMTEFFATLTREPLRKLLRKALFVSA
jgi:hypothetical protein